MGAQRTRVKHRGRPMTQEEKDKCHISRRHKCPVCGKVYYIGTEEERNAWECITETSQGFYIAQCGYCGGLITVNARGEDYGKAEVAADE